jgi:SAM-dependent methyltransferase
VRPTSDPAGLSRLAPTVARFARAGLFHYGRLLGNGYRVLREVESALAAEADERVLDVGCGTGGNCVAVPGDYVGIDLDPDYVAFAQWRWGSGRRQFHVADLAQLDAGAGFDKAMLVNCLHHLSDATAAAVLATLRRIVRRRLVVVDAEPEASNRLQSFLLRHDRGAFIRPRAAQRRLLAACFAVVAEGQFRNTPHTVVQTLFVCEPKV